MCARLDNAEDALTALSFASQLTFLLMTAMIGLSVGSVALVARAHGADDPQRVERLMLQATLVTVLLSVLVAVGGNLLAAPFMRAMGASEPVVAEGVRYLQPILTGTVFTYLTILYGAVMRAVGNTRLAFMVALGANVINIGLNYGLILGNFGLPALGVQGAAIGTVISYALSVLALVTLIRRGSVPGLMLPLRVPRLDWPLARELFGVGAPAALDSIILNVSFLAVIGMLGRIDEIAVAAHGIGIRIQALAFVPGLGVSQATAAMVGQALGRGDVAEAREVVRASVKMCLLIMTTLGLVFVAFAVPIVAAFDASPDVPLGEYSLLWIRILGVAMPIFGVVISLVGVLQGAGATRTLLRVSFVSTVVVQVPLGLLLAFPLGLGAFGVWLSFPLGFGLKAAMAAAVYRQGGWAKVGVGVG